MTEQNKPVERVIGLDAHPESFTACVLRGTTPASAVFEKMFNKIPISNLENWVKKNVNSGDSILLEASSNSFTIVRRLEAGCRRQLLHSEIHRASVPDLDLNANLELHSDPTNIAHLLSARKKNHTKRAISATNRRARQPEFRPTQQSRAALSPRKPLPVR